MKHERTKLFMDQLRALIRHLKYAYPDNISIEYIGNDEHNRDIYFVCEIPARDALPMLIVYWDGVKMHYEELAVDPDEFIYEPKKSSKDECLSLVSELERYLACVAPHGFMFKGIEGKAEETIAKLKELLLKDNT